MTGCCPQICLYFICLGLSLDRKKMSHTWLHTISKDTYAFTTHWLTLPCIQMPCIYQSRWFRISLWWCFQKVDLPYFLPAAGNSIPGGLSPVEIIFIIPVMNEALMISLRLYLRSLAMSRFPATTTAKCYSELLHTPFVWISKMFSVRNIISKILFTGWLAVRISNWMSLIQSAGWINQHTFQCYF